MNFISFGTADSIFANILGVICIIVLPIYLIFVSKSFIKKILNKKK